MASLLSSSFFPRNITWSGPAPVKYSAYFSLNRIMPGVDNFHYDVHLSPLFCESVAKIIFHLILKISGTDEDLDIGFDWVKEREEFKHLCHDIMLDAVKSNTKLIFIDNPINPTGTMVTKDEIDKFLKQIPENILVILDEAYYEYINHPDYPDSSKYLYEGKNIVILRTFSKIYGLAGARLGYGFANSEIISNLMKLRISFNVNRISQHAGLAALDDYEHVENGRKINEAGKEFLYDAYEKLGLFYVPTYGNFVFVDFNKDSLTVFESLQRHGIIARTIKEYGFPNALRITIGTEKQNRKLIKTLKKIL